MITAEEGQDSSITAFEESVFKGKCASSLTQLFTAKHSNILL